jgi:hypothetical protein
LCTKETVFDAQKNAKPLGIHDLAFGAEIGAERTGFVGVVFTTLVARGTSDSILSTGGSLRRAVPSYL